MAQPDNTRTKRFLIALLVGALAGAIVGTLIRAKLSATTTPAPPDGGTVGEGAVSSAIEESVAWEYARAYQEGDWDRVLELTLWAQERLQLVLESEGPAVVAAERDVLVAGFGERSIVDNQLNDTGVEDQYVFAPGTQLNYESIDEGRDDLERPVVRRTWLKVVYPSRDKAMRDSEGLPIRSVRVGINVSEDGFVLKANVIGNLDIDWASITYDWPHG